MAGDEIVQIYIGYNGSQVDRPVKDLKAFARVTLQPCETKTISFEVKASDLAYYNTEKKAWETEEIEYLLYAGPSSRAEDLLKATFNISGE